MIHHPEISSRLAQELQQTHRDEARRSMLRRLARTRSATSVTRTPARPYGVPSARVRAQG
jgi:hypothetical protein